MDEVDAPTKSTQGAENVELALPEKPEKPLDSDCCGNGCATCVLDIYAEELAIWEKECARIRLGETSTAVPKEVTDEEYVVRILHQLYNLLWRANSKVISVLCVCVCVFSSVVIIC